MKTIDETETREETPWGWPGGWRPPGTSPPESRPPKKLSDFRRTVRLFRRFAGSPKPYVAGILLLIFEALTSIIEPYPIAYLVDFLTERRPNLSELGFPAFVESPQINTLILLTIAIVGIAAINSAADSLTEVAMARGGRRLGYSIRVAMYSHLQRLSLSYHDKKRTGDVLTRVTGDVLGGRRVRGAVGQQRPGQPAGARRQSGPSVLAVLERGPGGCGRRVRCSPSSPTSTRAGSRRRRRPSAAKRASWPPPPRRCSPRSGWCRATAAVGSTSSSSPRRPRRACAPPWVQPTSRPSSASS